MIQKSIQNWILASTEADLGWANNFGMLMYQYYLDIALIKFFWLNFVFLVTYEQVCMHFSLNSAPCILIHKFDIFW